MKLIIRKSDNVAIWGSDNNQTTVEVVDNKLVIDGVVIATGVDETNYTLVEEAERNLISPFFPGYVKYESEILSYTQQYLNMNEKFHSCTSTVYLEYQDSHPEYADELLSILNIQYLEPSYQIPTPPDQDFPWYPNCWFN